MLFVYVWVSVLFGAAWIAATIAVIVCRKSARAWATWIVLTAIMGAVILFWYVIDQAVGWSASFVST